MTFPTTAWSVIEDVKGRQPAERLAAMNRFIVGGAVVKITLAG